jgi:hypothetical protein
MPENDVAVEDITEVAWEDLALEGDEGAEVPQNSTSGAFTFTYDQGTIGSAR